MEKHASDARNEVLDEIIFSRRSIRGFTDEVPTREMLESILAAGLAAPFAETAVAAARDFRRFVVIPNGTGALETVVSLLREKGQAQFDAAQHGPSSAAPFLKKLEALARGRIPGLGTAPYLIVVAERRGVPPVEQQSIAHCLENMWLKATALGLGFHLVSALAMLSDEPRFWTLVGLPAATYGLNGCAVGKPAAVPQAKPRPAVAEATIWMG